MAKPVHRPFLVLLFFVFAVFEQALSHLHRPHVIRGPCKSSSRPGAHNCTQKFYKQKKDHFSYRPGATPYLQQYLTYDEYWRGPGGPVFFYVGNEGRVETYADYTGLMWELGKKHGALLVFGEHRYYGKSQPFGPDSLQKDPSLLSIDQALADFATLIYHVQDEYNSPSSPVIGFGGSYGGMLAAWLRQKYPQALQGAIAASAPVGAYHSRLNPGFKPSKFWEVVTYDASPEAGAAEHCRNNTHRLFELLLSRGDEEAFQEQVAQAFGLCSIPGSAADLEKVAYWIQGFHDAAAMGNYPYPSEYMGGALPAWPMRAACELLAEEDLSDAELLQAMSRAVSLLYNATGDKACYDQGDLVGPASPGDVWLFQWCTQRAGQELPYYPANGRTDMFWDQGPYSEDDIREECLKKFSVTGDVDETVILLGGFEGPRHASNIVFSNGEYDPWRIGGIMEDVSESVVAVFIEQGAHHLDLMFSHPDDPPSVRAARELEESMIVKWIEEYREEGGRAAS